MGRPYSIDLRERVQATVDGGQSRRGAARHYDVSASFAVKLADRVLRTGSAKPARQGRAPGGGKLAPHLVALLEWVVPLRRGPPCFVGRVGRGQHLWLSLSAEL
jgi:transposase